MQVLKILMYGLHAIISISLVVLVMMQTHKAEGLGAVGGGGSQPSLRGRAGVEEKLSEYTRYLAIAFMIMSTILFIMAERFGWS
jgi:protein translocase SecG subunit